MDVAGCPVRLNRISYTGDLGYEMWMEPCYERRVYTEIKRLGKSLGVVDFGMRALLKRPSAPRMATVHGVSTRRTQTCQNPLCSVTATGKLSVGSPPAAMATRSEPPSHKAISRRHSQTARRPISKLKSSVVGDVPRLRSNRCSIRPAHSCEVELSQTTCGAWPRSGWRAILSDWRAALEHQANQLTHTAGARFGENRAGLFLDGLGGVTGIRSVPSRTPHQTEMQYCHSSRDCR